MKQNPMNQQGMPMQQHPMPMPFSNGQPYVQPQFQQQVQVPTPSGAPMGPMPGAAMPGLTPEGMLPFEQSYVENILRFNRGKMATFYMTYEYNPEWPARIFRGVIDEAGRDHIIISNPETGKSYLLLMVSLDYVEFDEPIEYIPPTFPGAGPALPQR